MLKRLQETLQTECGLHPDMRLVAGVSGGPDSLCLLDALNELGFSPLVAHLNHKLRPEAEGEALKVREAAEGYRLPFVEEQADTLEFARTEGLSVEEAGRTLRYQFLFEQARRWEANAVCVAHTADDQVETVLMHLLRGTGLSGLKGMQLVTLPNAWSSEIPLVRPLLLSWRAETLAYCSERELQPVFDLSNLDSTYFRNRLRKELIPYLEEYNPRIKESILHMAEILQGDFEVIERLVEDAWQAAVTEVGSGFVSLSAEELRSQPAGIQRHLIRRAIASLRPGLRDIGFDAIEKGIQFLTNASSPAQSDLVAGLRLILERDFHREAGEGKDRLWIATWEADLPPGDWPAVKAGVSLPLSIPGETRLPEGWVLQASEVRDHERARQKARDNPDPYQAWISLDSSPGPLEVRARKPGDRFQPLGFAKGHLKISDFMINQKLPRRARRSWPLVVAGESVVWVPGFQIGNPYRLTQDTRWVIHLSLRRSRSEMDR